MTYTVSAGKVDITPTGYMCMAGSATVTGPRLATGVYGRLYARCIVLRDGSQTRVLVSADVVGFGRVWSQTLRSDLVSLAGCTSADLLLLASHTHNGPMMSSPDPQITHNASATDLAVMAAYESWLADQIDVMVGQVLDDPGVACTLDYAATSVTGSKNRAGAPVPSNQIETTVPVLTFRKTDGTPAAVLYGCPTHPITAGTLTLFDGDYPGVASAVVEAAVPGCVAMASAGAMGDQDPDPAIVGTLGLTARYQFGSKLGKAVLDRVAVPGRALSMPTTASAEISVPLDLSAGATATRAAYVPRSTDGSVQEYERRHALAMIDQIDAATYAIAVPVGATVWKFPGSPMLRWLFSSGELISGYAVYYRTLYGGTNGIVLGGHANDVCCYVTGQQFLPTGRSTTSYEGGWRSGASSIAAQSQAAYGWVSHFKGNYVAGQSIEYLLAHATGLYSTLLA